MTNWNHSSYITVLSLLNVFQTICSTYGIRSSEPSILPQSGQFLLRLWWESWRKLKWFFCDFRFLNALFCLKVSLVLISYFHFEVSLLLTLLNCFNTTRWRWKSPCLTLTPNISIQHLGIGVVWSSLSKMSENIVLH